MEYQYDQLGRLISAATQGAGGWGLAWNHDGFGNLTQQSVTKGQMTGFTLSINGATNRVNHQNYDANGNWLGMWGQAQTYDIDNRVHTASSTQHQETYLYSARNERIVSKRDQDRHRVHFYGADGLLLGIYTLEITQQNPSYTYPVRLAEQERVYFGGRLMQIGGESVATDRLGSVVRKGSTNYKYAPYGQEIGGATANDTTKFATYTRDSVSGLDYALNRYYKPEWGRFTSPDPYQASGGPSDPGSWNRYAYVGGDPVNYNDPEGLFRELPHSYLEAPDGGVIWIGSVAIGYGLWNAQRSYWTGEYWVDGGVFPLAFPDWLRHDVHRAMLPPLCGVNPLTGLPGIRAVNSGRTGEIRPGEGGVGFFGDPRNGGTRPHNGVDIAGVSGESSVVSALAGTVTFSGSMTGFGTTVVVDVGHGFFMYYAHLASTSVAVGDVLAQGDTLGVVGRTGNARGQRRSEDHLHFEIRKGPDKFDPIKFLNTTCPWSTP